MAARRPSDFPHRGTIVPRASSVDPNAVNVMITDPTKIEPARSGSAPLHTWRRYLSFFLSIISFGLAIVALFTLWWVDANTSIGKINIGLWSYGTPLSSSSRLNSSFALGSGFYIAGIVTLICCCVGLFLNLIVLIITLNMLSRHTRSGHDLVVVFTWCSGLIYLVGALLYELLRPSFKSVDMGYNYSATIYLIAAITMTLGAWFLLYETSAITPSITTVPLQSIQTINAPPFGIQPTGLDTQRQPGFTDVNVHPDDEKQAYPPIPIEDDEDDDDVEVEPVHTLRVTSTEAVAPDYKPKGFIQAVRDGSRSNSSRSSSGSSSSRSGSSSSSGSGSRTGSESRSGSSSGSGSGSGSRSGSTSNSRSGSSTVTPRMHRVDEGAQETGTGTVIGVDGVARQVRGALSHRDEFDMSSQRRSRPQTRTSIIQTTASRLAAVDNSEFSNDSTVTPRHGRSNVVMHTDPRFVRQSFDDPATIHLGVNPSNRTTVHIPSTSMSGTGSGSPGRVSGLGTGTLSPSPGGTLRLSRGGNLMPLPPVRRGEGQVLHLGEDTDTNTDKTD